MNKKTTLIVCLVILAFISAAYIVSVNFNLISGLISESPLMSGKGIIPNNPNITQQQKVLYTNTTSVNSSATLDDKRKLLYTAAVSSVDSNQITLSENCQTSIPVIKVYSYSQVGVLNTAKYKQELLIHGNSYVLEPSHQITLSMSMINPKYSTTNGLTMTSYTCRGLKSPAGFIVVYPE